MADQTGMTTFSPSSVPAQQSQAPAVPRQVSPNVVMTGITDESIKQYEFELYQAQQGKTDRAFVLRPMDIAKGRVHFHDKIKGSGIVCNSVYVYDQTAEQDILQEEKQCCKWLGPPTVRFATLLLLYVTDQNGGPVHPFKYGFKLWRFGGDKFKDLRSLNKDYPLAKYDIKILCNDKQYQRLTITAAPPDPETGSGSWVLDPRFPQAGRDSIFAWANASVAKLPNELGGRRFDNDLLLQQFLMQQGVLSVGGATPTMQPSDAPVRSFADVINTTAVHAETVPSSSAPALPASPVPGFPAA